MLEKILKELSSKQARTFRRALLIFLLLVVLFWAARLFYSASKGL